MRYPSTPVNARLPAFPAITALRARLAPLTRDAGHDEWLARVTAHLRPSYLPLPDGLTEHEVRRTLTTDDTAGGLPLEYRRGLLRRAGRDVRWPGLPLVSDVLHGLTYAPTGRDDDRGRHARHVARRGLAEAVATRLDVLLPYLRDGRLARLTWSREQVVTEAAHRARAAEQVAMENGTRWNGTEDVLQRDYDPAWHRRQLRQEIGRTDGHVSWVLGLTGGRPGDGTPRYCSGWTLARARQDAAANRAWAANSIHVKRDGYGRPAVDADGKAITVSTADLISGSRRARRAQLYALCLATQQMGERLGYVLAFATLTLPSRFHPNPASGGTAYEPTTTPQDARDEQQRRWHRARALMHKRNVRSFAGQARELHSDGAPHVHVCEYVHPDDLQAWTECLTRHWPEAAAHAGRELADGVACQVRTWDGDGAASVASYLYGYASKSIDDSDGENADGDAAAHAAACRRDRLRRWSWVGYRRGLAGDWQRVARERECPDCPVLGAVWTAIRDRRYADALESLGALTPRSSPVKRDYEPTTNRYGEEGRRPYGLRRATATEDELCDGLATVLRFHPTTWTRKDIAGWEAEQWTHSTLDAIRIEANVDAERMREEAWTRVCTLTPTWEADWLAGSKTGAVAVKDSVPRRKEDRAGTGAEIVPLEREPPPISAAEAAFLDDIQAGWLNAERAREAAGRGPDAYRYPLAA